MSQKPPALAVSATDDAAQDAAASAADPGASNSPTPPADWSSSPDFAAVSAPPAFLAAAAD
eukprot:6524653-Lingulodinium_polyedra.AAC.1